MTGGDSSKTSGFPKRLRLRKQAEFDRVFGGKVYAADDTLVMNGTSNELGRSRIGLSVSRKVGNAVARNRWKRLLREAFRTQQSELPQGFDLVVRPRRGATPDFLRIRASLRSLAERIARKLQRGRS
ncbi:MAG: ribonuclease P protein component [Planctomycetaceae bacterium]|nr:ribonuclease P protein component [Planctomycetales bacterium]MCB9925125.1 ribonuclease P protein component [Planctomycetaceae bacterium]